MIIAFLFRIVIGCYCFCCWMLNVLIFGINQMRHSLVWSDAVTLGDVIFSVKVPFFSFFGHAAVGHAFVYVSHRLRSWLRATVRLLACCSTVGPQEWYILSSGLSRLQWLANTPFSFHLVCCRNHAVSPYKYIFYVRVVFYFHDERGQTYSLVSWNF